MTEVGIGIPNAVLATSLKVLLEEVGRITPVSTHLGHLLIPSPAECRGTLAARA